MWQDVNVNQRSHDADPPEQAGEPSAAYISQVETLKALAAPIRLRMVYALARGAGGDRVMSVKELAEELGEPQTRLYRHVKVLEAAGLIEVAATRLVSGIVEQRYRSTRRDFQLGPGMARSAQDAAEAAVIAVARVYSEEFFAAYREGRFPDRDDPDTEAYRKPVLMVSDSRVSVARATSIRIRLREIIDELNGPDDPDGVLVKAMIGFFSLDEQAAGQEN